MTRLDIRINDQLKTQAERVAALRGLNLTSYLTSLIRRDVDDSLEELESLTLNETAFDRFVAACETADAPSQSLSEAKNRAAELGFK